MLASVEELREKVAISCRILALEELVEDTLGHVSARVPRNEEVLIRCRGAEERGLMYTTKEAVRQVSITAAAAPTCKATKCPTNSQSTARSVGAGRTSAASCTPTPISRCSVALRASRSGRCSAATARRDSA